MKIILMPDHLVDETTIEEKVFGKNFVIKSFNNNNKNDIPEKLWHSCSGILVWHHCKINKKIIDKLQNCKVIVRIGVGFDSIDLSYARKKNIKVCNVPDYGTNDVADHAISLMLSLARGINKFNYEIKANNYWDWDAAGELYRLAGLNMGILGLGRIGTAAGLRAKAFGMRILFYDPYVSDGIDKSLMFERCDKLDEFLSLSDVVSIHTPLTDETKLMVNESFLSKMKQSAILINTARGQIFDLGAIYNALKSNNIHAVGTDVLPVEPPEKDNQLINSWRINEDWLSGRLIITPHAAFYNKDSFIEMRQKAAKEALRVIIGKDPRNCLNFD